MTPWLQRPWEERTLLNPAFCAHLLWHAARGYADVGNSFLPFEEAFLILPFVLHRETREALPRDTRTSLVVWLEHNALARGRVARRAQLLATFTKEGLLFGGQQGFIRIEQGRLYGVETWKRAVSRSLRASSDEVRVCTRKAEFVGKWFAQAGSATTVLALLGVRP